jgi:hypothetical protein
MADRMIAISNRTLATVDKCIQPDDTLTHVFNVRTVDFDNENGAKITVKVLFKHRPKDLIS